MTKLHVARSWLLRSGVVLGVLGASAGVSGVWVAIRAPFAAADWGTVALYTAPLALVASADVFVIRALLPAISSQRSRQRTRFVAVMAVLLLLLSAIMVAALSVVELITIVNYYCQPPDGC